MELAEARRSILSIYCNDTHAFCGQPNGTVGVYNMGSGQLVRELAPAEGGKNMSCDNFIEVAGSEEVVAAAYSPTWGYKGHKRVVVWSSRGKMEELHSLNVDEYSCSNDSCEHQEALFTEIKSVLVFDRSKVAVMVHQWLIRQRLKSSVSLILLEKVNSKWENKNLGCFPFRTGSMASDGAWLGLLVGRQNKIKLWHGNESQQDIFLTENDSKFVNGVCLDVGMFFEFPHIVLSAQNGFPILGNAHWIRVYKIEAGVLHLVKSIRFGSEGYCKLRPISNKVRLGFLETRSCGGATIVHLFEKRKLFSDGLSPAEDKERRRIEVEGNPIAMNSFCLLSCLLKEKGVSSDSEGEDEQEGVSLGLMKKDFWM